MGSGMNRRMLPARWGSDSVRPASRPNLAVDTARNVGVNWRAFKGVCVHGDGCR